MGPDSTPARGPGATGFEATADNEGVFDLYDPPPGDWKVLADPDGYYPLRTSDEIVVGEGTEAT